MRFIRTLMRLLSGTYRGGEDIIRADSPEEAKRMARTVRAQRRRNRPGI